MVQRLWYYVLRTYVWIGLRFYFKKIIVHGRENIPDGPLIFVANHQNSFMDALMIVCHTPQITHFLARADVFKKRFLGWLLNTLNMVPIYRIRDGWQTLSENQETFNRCGTIFLKNEAVVIFPEGNHGSERRLRPLSRGFVKIAFESLKKYPDLKIDIVPVGLNYSDHNAFRGSVSVYFGEAIQVRDFFREPLQSQSNRLREEVVRRLQCMITHIDAAHYSEIFRKLESTHPDYLDPFETNERISKIENGETISDTRATLKNKSLSLLHYPAQLLHFIPLFFWRKIKSKIKDPALLVSLDFVFGIFAFPLFYLLTAIVIYVLWGSIMAGCWLIICFISPLFLRK